MIGKKPKSLLSQWNVTAFTYSQTCLVTDTDPIQPKIGNIVSI